MDKTLNITRRLFLSRIPAAATAVGTLAACALPALSEEAAEPGDRLHECAMALVEEMQARGSRWSLLVTADDYSVRPLPGQSYPVRKGG